MISNLFEFLYNKVFINIVTDGSISVVYIELCKKDEVISNIEESFDTEIGHKKMLDFIEPYTKESPFHYISYLDHSPNQGAFTSSFDRSEFFDAKLTKFKHYDKNWLYFTPHAELNTLRKKYADIGVDYIFSPFVLLAEFFKDKQDNKMTMFVLLEKNYITLSIFDKSHMLFSEYIAIEHKKNMKSDNDEDSFDMDDFDLDDMSIDLEDVDVEDMDNLDDIIDELDDLDSLDDLSDIEDLDSMDEIDEFSQDEEVEYAPQNLESDTEAPSELNDVYKIFSMIQDSVNTFYNNPKFDSKFIETVYIADDSGNSQNLKQYLEDEMFLSVYVRRIDLCVEVCELAKKEQV